MSVFSFIDSSLFFIKQVHYLDRTKCQLKTDSVRDALDRFERVEVLHHGVMLQRETGLVVQGEFSILQDLERQAEWQVEQFVGVKFPEFA
jgi:hypothetical protein